MGRTLSTILAAALLVIAPVAALADLTPGTTLTGNIDQNLSSNHAFVGERVSISNAYSPNHDINGATIYGHVSDVQSAGQGRPGKITLAFDQVRTRSGGNYSVVGYATNMNVQTKNNRENVNIPQGSAVSVQVVRSRRQSS